MQDRQQGMALLITLEVIVLLTVLVVSFLSRAGTEGISASKYRSAASTLQLADTAVNLVQAQINHATTQGPGNVWASQPGAIRLYDSGGNLTCIYRLYSAGSLTTTAVGDLDNDVPLVGWADSPAIWVDLNAPTNTILASGTQTSFPILDPRDPANTANTVTMEGFALNNPPGAQADPTKPNYQPAPMPTRWLYVLQNGEIASPDDSGNGKSVTVPGASGTNPIVGRVAFWTDDETCKVNINTASISGTTNGDGTFWDTPRFNFQDDRDLGLYQPTQGEYQRYPGHPATTTLNKVLAGIGATGAVNHMTRSEVLNLLPRYSDGGSQAGTVKISTSGSIPKKSDRLFTSAGELLFSSSVSSLTRVPTGINKQQMETARFFLTAHSRAPEINLFGMPRVSIWPIHDTNDANHRSTIDQLIAFCATTGTGSSGYPYYFKRKDNTSPSVDINLTRNQQLLGYLDRLQRTTIPGFGGNFYIKYQADQRQILTEIFDFIRSTNLRDPSVCTSYADASGTFGKPSVTPGAGQVIPTVNPVINGAAWNTQGIGRFARVAEASLLLIGMGQGAVTGAAPAVVTGSYNVSLTSTAATAVPNDQKPTFTGTGGGYPLNNSTAVQAFFLLNFFDPAQGYSYNNPSFTVEVKNLDQFQYADVPLNMPHQAVVYAGGLIGGAQMQPLPYASFTDGGKRGGGPMDFRVLIGMRPLGNNSSTQFPFYSNIVTIPNTSGISGAYVKYTSKTLSAANLTINIYAGRSTNSQDLIQTYHIDFPETTLPVPLVEPAITGTLDHRNLGTSGTKVWNTIPEPTDRAAFVYADEGVICRYLINPKYDTIISMIPASAYSDYRLLASSTIPSPVFVPHPNAGQRMGHSLRLGAGQLLSAANGASATTGKLVASASPHPFYPDIVPPTLNGAYISGSTIPGDWDNGVADFPDGPYINLPDEGNSHIGSSSATTYFGDAPWSYSTMGGTLFSPNREVPSPVIFGSLPTGVARQKPWQTLLFRPGPTGHPGLDSPKDHLLLDLFWMPVAEPYAISEPFSTAGKVNMNYQIVPFNYITRSTALRSVLASEKVASVNSSLASSYKMGPNGDGNTPVSGTTARLPLNLEETLKQFEDQFSGSNTSGVHASTTKDIFRSATQICDIYLVPSNYTSVSSFATDWFKVGANAPFALVGDNTRERPYANIYPRLTTKSNVYTVYFTVQAVKNLSKAQTQWNEDKGQIVGEYRGSTKLERYIDPNNASLVDYATASGTDSLDSLYKWRIVESTRFAP